MHYRRVSYRYAMVVQGLPRDLLDDLWARDRLRPLVPPRWQPDVDVYETARTIEVLVDLAGVDEADYEVRLFEDALVVEGQRRLPACREDGVYQVAGIRQGPFHLEVPLRQPVERGRVDARYDRGLLHITLRKERGAP
jgi:HSP20 family protein